MADNVEEVYSRLGDVFYHDCYIDKKPEGTGFQPNPVVHLVIDSFLFLSQLVTSMPSSYELLKRRPTRLQSYSEPPALKWVSRTAA